MNGYEEISFVLCERIVYRFTENEYHVTDIGGSGVAYLPRHDKRHDSSIV